MKNFTLFEVALIILVTLAGIAWSIMFNILLLIGFMPGFLFLFYLCFKKGNALRELFQYALQGFMKTKEVMLILTLVGLLLPSWQAAGTIDGMVQLILSFMNPDYFFISAFLSTLLVSMILGTSVGSLSAIGIPIIGAAHTLGLSVELTAGALVSGAFVGDRTSLFSSANQLLSNTLEINRKLFQKTLWKSGSVGIGLSLLFFFIADIQLKEKMDSLMVSKFEGNIIVMIPIILLILLALIRFNIKTCFMVSIAAALVIMVFYQGVPLQFDVLWNGTKTSGGGLEKMISLVAFIGLAGAYNGIVEALGIFHSFLTRWLQSSETLLAKTWKTMCATMFISLLACNQTLPIILTGRTFLSDWTKSKHRDQLARVMADSSMLFAGMIPWSVLAIMCSTILRVPILDYLIYAIYLWSLPFVTLIFSYHMTRRNRNTSNIPEVSTSL
ncbi:NhaC family Na+:H+ antiporter [Bacillus mesophilus]|uniref:Sodium:proton antiporter n=1 Tax=Bacillus mesophilus TaxID=1808955 RepID=A0A6M0Q352_9BACI|nr:Na+/H+ antiporter NhaC family protein [Bacillus mesophilus]MBM7659782.1 NhaC family Na+:H+ antiporter [Bacillus mesophilus]NEY70642.1 sodium:proton antiporter [Bacillus mesophilus]